MEGEREKGSIRRDMGTDLDDDSLGNAACENDPSRRSWEIHSSVFDSPSPHPLLHGTATRVE